jgi:hypothetical protein
MNQQVLEPFTVHLSVPSPRQLSREGLVNNKIAVYTVSLVGFLLLFLVMDFALQHWQGLELIP